MEILKYMNDSINSIPADVKIEYEKVDYVLSGYGREKTNAYIEVFNKYNERIDCIIKLKTKGSMRFIGNEDTFVVRTSADKKTVVPVYITGAGECGLVIDDFLEEVK